MKLKPGSIRSFAFGALIAGSCQALSLPVKDDVDLHASVPLEPRAGPGSNVPRLPRLITIVNDVVKSQPIYSPKYQQHLFPIHTFVLFEKTETEGPMRVEITVDESTGHAKQYGIRAADLTDVGLDGGDAGPNPNVLRRAEPLHQHTTVTNEELMSSVDGHGAILQVWGADPVYRKGPPMAPDVPRSYNGCNTLVRKLLQHPRVLGPTYQIPASIEYLTSRGAEYASLTGPREDLVVTNLHLERLKPKSSATHPTRKTFHFDPSDPSHAWLAGETNPSTGVFYWNTLDLESAPSEVLLPMAVHEPPGRSSAQWAYTYPDEWSPNVFPQDIGLLESVPTAGTPLNLPHAIQPSRVQPSSSDTRIDPHIFDSDDEGTSGLPWNFDPIDHTLDGGSPWDLPPANLPSGVEPMRDDDQKVDVHMFDSDGEGMKV